jgi:hypothetical protein
MIATADEDEGRGAAVAATAAEAPVDPRTRSSTEPFCTRRVGLRISQSLSENTGVGKIVAEFAVGDRKRSMSPPGSTNCCLLPPVDPSEALSISSVCAAAGVVITRYTSCSECGLES